MGERAAVEAAVDCRAAEVIDAAGCVVAPGFVDSHTHLVFGGSRVDEYAARMTESDPAALRARGIKTGILATVERTRAASEEALTAEAAARLRGMLRAGTTTVESKSGYGLSTEAELKLLRVNRSARRRESGRPALHVPRGARVSRRGSARGLSAHPSR